MPLLPINISQAKSYGGLQIRAKQVGRRPVFREDLLPFAKPASAVHVRREPRSIDASLSESILGQILLMRPALRRAMMSG